ncbi:glutathione S-transferase N-terminal domain-containing protein [Sulfitobacter sp. TSTF-M16]|uniref:Glutathione S-transferase N-terminal domain-containing protein n=1 Tax=Sulfitobacter aestuariivivens TaxID=2766981 RepID=A0A927D3B6_9RHOB|nr:glutathione S-transferase N-terminal domain-containing protein [Sulfitobacter aestuariivivens]MBD3664250.1 glutathione S-transferase N-terminal domain-containing protein [Sulfitobacter aestuariivivens]
MTLIVHGRASSSNVQAVMWGAAELGLTVERRDVGGKFGGNDAPEYRALNPMGLIPTLEDGATVMFESAAILRYLVAQYPRSDFCVTPQADMWAEWAKGTLSRAFLLPVFWGYYRTPEAERDMDQVRVDFRTYEGLLGMAMRQRGDNKWLMGDRISLADIWAGHLLFRYFTIDLPRDVPFGLQAYYDMLCARDAFQTHVMVDYSELKGRLAF